MADRTQYIVSGVYHTPELCERIQCTGNTGVYQILHGADRTQSRARSMRALALCWRARTELHTDTMQVYTVQVQAVMTRCMPAYVLCHSGDSTPPRMKHCF